jgi:branched-chain amino acid transport system permease protein
VRGQDLSRLMVTLGIGLLLFEAANKLAFTGGVDGLVRRHDVEALRRVLVRSRRQDRVLVQPGRAVHRVPVREAPGQLAVRPVAARGAREREADAGARRIVDARPVGGCSRSPAGIAGIAGALLAQTTQFVGLDTLGLPRSADLLIILVLGGTGRLYGALIGAGRFHGSSTDLLSNIDPVYWQFGSACCWC